MPGAAAVRDDRSRLDGLSHTYGEAPSCGRMPSRARHHGRRRRGSRSRRASPRRSRCRQRLSPPRSPRALRCRCPRASGPSASRTHSSPGRSPATPAARHRWERRTSPAAGWARSDRRGEGRTLLLELGDLCQHRIAIAFDRLEVGTAVCLGSDERIAARRCPHDQRLLLVDTSTDCRRELGGLRAGQLASSACLQDVIARGRDLDSRCARPAHRSC